MMIRSSLQLRPIEKFWANIKIELSKKGKVAADINYQATKKVRVVYPNCLFLQNRTNFFWLPDNSAKFGVWHHKILRKRSPKRPREVSTLNFKNIVISWKMMFSKRFAVFGDEFSFKIILKLSKLVK